MMTVSLRRRWVAASADATAFGELKILGITFRVFVTMAEPEMKPHRTLVMCPAAGGVYL